jgi:hypothetical protein
MTMPRRFTRQLGGYVHKFRFEEHHEAESSVVEPKREDVRAAAPSIGRRLAQILPRYPIRSAARSK